MRRISSKVPMRHRSAVRRRSVSRNPQLMLITNPVRRKARRNPQLMLITNPVSKNISGPSVSSVTKAKKAFKKFHMINPTHSFERNVPDGWPEAYVIIGEVEKFEVEDANGKRHKKTYRGKRPIVATTGGMKKLYIFGSKSLGLPSGTAIRIDYKVPADSGRNKWSSRWYHPHSSHPSVKVAPGGRALVVSGRGMKINKRGIIG